MCVTALFIFEPSDWLPSNDLTVTVVVFSLFVVQLTQYTAYHTHNSVHTISLVSSCCPACDHIRTLRTHPLTSPTAKHFTMNFIPILVVLAFAVKGSFAQSSPLPGPDSTPLNGWTFASGLGMLAIGFVATFVLLSLTCSRIESTCGQRTGKELPTPGAVRANTPLIAAALAFWWAATLLTMAPILPWAIVNKYPQYVVSRNCYESNCPILYTAEFTRIGTLFGTSWCAHCTSPGTIDCPKSACNSPTLYLPVLDEGNAENSNYAEDPKTVAAFKGLVALGSLMIIVAVVLILPAAILTSVSAYRVSKSLRYNTPLVWGDASLYNSGCTCTNLRNMKLLGGIACLFTTILFIATQASVAADIALLKTAYYDRSSIYAVLWVAQPGSFAASLAAVCLVVGVVLLRVVEKANLVCWHRD